MPIPQSPKKYVDKTKAERLIDQVINNDEELTQSDLNKVYCQAQVDYRIELYRTSVKDMSRQDLLAEAHDSERLAEHMTLMGDPRPHELAECHAIVAGRHPAAAVFRTILAKLGRRIDDPINGCWLPKNTAAKPQMPRRLSNAVSHRRIHREYYYQWMGTKLSLATTKTLKDLDAALVGISFRLQTGTFPDYVMLPKGAEIPL